MPDPREPNTLSNRLITMSERLARVEHRTESLETCLPRISALEAGVARLTANIEQVAADVHHIESTGRQTLDALQALKDQHGGLNQRISQLFWTGAGAMLMIGLLVSAINVGSTLAELPYTITPRGSLDPHRQPGAPQHPPPQLAPPRQPHDHDHDNDDE